MTKSISLLLAATALAGLSCGAQAADIAARPGAPAPDFTATDIAGHAVRLSDYAGKTIILEWTNDGCPFVGKHYNSGNMQALQRKYTGEGDVWLTIASSAPGEQGYVTPAEAQADLARWQAAPSDFLLDPDGVVGRLYDARATPHIVVIDRGGRVAYMGAIDDTPVVLSRNSTPSRRCSPTSAVTSVRDNTRIRGLRSIWSIR